MLKKTHIIVKGQTQEYIYMYFYVPQIGKQKAVI